MVDTPETTTPAPAASEPPVAGGKARWSWLAALGLTLAALGPLLMLAGGALWGLEISDEVGFFGVTGVAGLIGAFLVLRFGVWAKVLGIVVAILVGGALFWTAFGLFAPNSFFDFVPGLLVIPGALIAIVGCIASIVAGRRGHRSAAPVGGERRAVRIVESVVLVLAIVSAGLTFAARSQVEGEGDLAVALTDFEYDQDSYEVDGGSSVVVRNDDPYLHTFTIDELGIDEQLSPGSEVLVEIPAQAGDYVVYCKPHTFDPEDPSEEDMAAEFSVR